jgi:nucleotide-binding universal stress UspA family protein
MPGSNFWERIGRDDQTNYRIEHGGSVDALCRGTQGTPHDGESAVKTPAAPAIAGAPAAAAVPLPTPRPRKKRSTILPRRILVAVDRSEQSRWALKLACELALSLKAELVLLHVVDSPCTFASHFAAAAPVSPQTQEGAELLHEIAACIPPSLSPLKILRHGNADREIVAAAAEWEADLIVLGTHGRGHVSRFFFLLGSVAEYVLRYAECPVITVSDDLTPYVAAEAQQPEQAEIWQDSLIGTG